MNKGKKTIILNSILVVTFLGLLSFFAFNYYQDKDINIDTVDTSDDFKYQVCSNVPGTPSWVLGNGTIIGIGYTDFGEDSKKIVNEYLIPNQIYFVYSTGCSYCKLQVQTLGETWNDYVSSGLTINCMELAQSE